MPLTMSSIPTQITTKHQHDKHDSSEDEDDCTEVLSLTSSSDLSTDACHRSTSFPPNTCMNFPSYFLCPITNSVMVDPVMDAEGNTFERAAILRWLVLYDSSPLTGNTVRLEELCTDTVVKGAIDKARKDAWVRYILDFEKDATTTTVSGEGEAAPSSSVSPGSNHSKKKIYVSPSPPGKSPSSQDKAGSSSKPQVERMPSLPIHVEAKSKKKITPSPVPSKSPSSKLHPPPPPPKSNKRTHSDKSHHSHNTTNNVEPITPSITIPPQSNSSNISACSNITFLPHNGWAVQLGVHKIICPSPGLAVTADIHRRSSPLQTNYVDINGKIAQKDLILPPGSYVEILETQVHGGRVRGRIRYEEDGDLLPVPKELLKKKRSFLKRRKNKKPENRVQIMSGWISLQWEEEDDEAREARNTSTSRGISNQDHRFTDEDEGPWTEPIPLGVYRITFGAGLPLRETPERDSTVLDKLERGRCVEVVETQVKGDRVRARCIVPPMPKEDGSTTGKFQSGWISLLNAMTGASGAQPVPLGAYVAVAESGCVITEGGRLDSKVRGNLSPGSCIEVVATRIEEGVVRGLIASGGHVTLFVPVVRGEGGRGAGKDGGRMFAMPVPLGTYQIIQNGVNITTGISSASPVSVKLKLDACAEIVETRVEDGRVRGRISAVGYGGVSKEARGWIDLFEPTCRWAKIVCFQGGRPIAPQG